MKLPHLHRRNIGRSGEAHAIRHLRQKGYRLLARNFRIRYGEIDCVFLNRGTTVFVEVKTRIGGAFGTPEEAVTPRKLREVVRTAEIFMEMHPEIPRLMRIDVVAVEMSDAGRVTDIRHIENVTG